MLRLLHNLVQILLTLQTFSCIWYGIACPGDQCDGKSWATHREGLLIQKQPRGYMDNALLTFNLGCVSTGTRPDSLLKLQFEKSEKSPEIISSEVHFTFSPMVKRLKHRCSQYLNFLTNDNFHQINLTKSNHLQHSHQ